MQGIKFLRKIRMSFGEISHQRSVEKISRQYLFIDFSKALDSIHREKMEQILPACSLTKEIATAVMMLYKNTRTVVCLPDSETDFFDIIARFLQGDTLTPFLFIICLDYVL